MVYYCSTWWRILKSVWYRWRYLLLVLYYYSVSGEGNGLDYRLILIRRWRTCTNAWRHWRLQSKDGALWGDFGLLFQPCLFNLSFQSVFGRDILCELATVGELPLPQASPMSTNKRDRDSDTPRSVASSESPQSVIQEDSPRVIAGSRRVNKDPSSSSQSMRTTQSQHQPNQQQRHPPQLPTSSMTTSKQPTQHADRSTTSVPPTPTYALPVYSDELGRLPFHGHVDFSTQAYLDQVNYWYQGVPNNRGIESSPNSDHIIPQNSVSHHSNRRQHQQVPDHHHLQSSHITSNFSNDTTETSTIAQGFSLNPTIGTGNMVFDPVPLTYIPPTTYTGVSPPIDIVPPQNPIRGGGGPSHSNFRGISMALRGDRGSSSVLNQRQESSQLPSHLEQPHHQHHQHHTQGPREHDVHGNHHHREQQQQQQQQPMDYSYVDVDKDTMSIWPTAPTGFEYVFFFIIISTRGVSDSKLFIIT